MLEFSVLKDLVRLLNKNKVKEITTIKEIQHENKSVLLLYQGLLSGKYQSDTEAALDIYGKNEDYPSYRRLRRRLFDLLVNTVFFIDTTSARYTEQEKTLYNCYRGFAAATILIRQDAKHAGIYLLKQLLEQAIKYEITTLTTEILRLLKRMYLSTQMSSEDIKKISKQIILYEEKRFLEIKAREVFEDLVEGYVSGRVSNKDIGVNLKDDYNHFLALADKVNTTNFYYLTHSIGYLYHLSQNQVHKSLESSIIAIKLLKSRKNTFKGQILGFAINQIGCYTQLRIFDTPEVKQSIDDCLQLVTNGTVNWFKVNEILVHHYIYSERYDEALEIHSNSINHPRFQFLSDTNKEIWKIYAGYFHLLARLNAIPEEKIIQKVGKLNVDQFEYDFKVLNTVKHGMNVPVIMIPIFFKTLEREFDEYGRSKESLRKYVDRHLRKRKNVRSTTMIKLLIALDKYPYQPLASKNAIKKLLTIFEEVPIELSEQSSVIEIVPYEKLWSLILRYRRVYL